MRRPILIDTDTGVDDALALTFAVRSPELDVKVITTVAGNVGVHLCTRNVQFLLRALGTSCVPPVIPGARKPLRLPLFTAPEVHGSDGFGNTLPPVRDQRSGPNRAPAAIAAFCREYGAKGTIIAIGPLTNIALAIKRFPAELRRIGRIITMGGAFRVPGNTGPVAEFNYYVDPHAAAIVLSSGLSVTVVPLDVTEQLILGRSELIRALARTDRQRRRLISGLTKDYMRFHLLTEGFNGGYLHDPLAVAVAARPSLVTTRDLHVDVETESALTRGMTVSSFRPGSRQAPPTVSVALRVDAAGFLPLFLGRIGS